MVDMTENELSLLTGYDGSLEESHGALSAWRGYPLQVG